MTCLGPADRAAARAVLDEIDRLREDSGEQTSYGLTLWDDIRRLTAECSVLKADLDRLKGLPTRTERCKHGVWLADRCWECDPNTGLEGERENL